MLSFRLFVDAADLGALNLYGSAAGVFTTDSQIVGALFAQHAALALAGSTRDDQLSDAIATRDVIGQAKGILMHRNRITGQQAFTLLVHASQHTQIKLCGRRPLDSRGARVDSARTARLTAVTSDFRLVGDFLTRLGCCLRVSR